MKHTPKTYVMRRANALGWLPALAFFSDSRTIGS